MAFIKIAHPKLIKLAFFNQILRVNSTLVLLCNTMQHQLQGILICSVLYQDDKNWFLLNIIKTSPSKMEEMRIRARAGPGPRAQIQGPGLRPQALAPRLWAKTQGPGLKARTTCHILHLTHLTLYFTSYVKQIYCKLQKINHRWR